MPSKRHNRLGFQNYGGRKTGRARGLINDIHVSCCRWIQKENAILVETKRDDGVYTDHFDVAFAPTGNVLRHDLRHLGLIFEIARTDREYKQIGLSLAAKKMLAGIKVELDANISGVKKLTATHADVDKVLGRAEDDIDPS